MKKKLGRAIMMMGVCASLMTVPMMAYASENVNGVQAENAVEREIQPRVNWSGSAYLAKDVWCNVTASNNLFPDKPTVTNDASNPGSITVRIVNEKGEVVGSEKAIGVGKNTKLDNIPAFSGTYTLQAKTSTAGTYFISID